MKYGTCEVRLTLRLTDRRIHPKTQIMAKTKRKSKARAGSRAAGGSSSEHVSHNLSISIGPDLFTVGKLKELLAALSVPDNATLKSASGKNWLWIGNVSFCRTMNEVSLW